MTSRAVSECDESLVIGLVEWEKAHDPVAGRRDWTRVRCLRSLPERADRQVSASAVVADSEMEPDSGLAEDDPELRRRVRHDVVPALPGDEVERAAGGAQEDAEERHERGRHMEVEDPLHDAHLLLVRDDREDNVEANRDEQGDGREEDALPTLDGSLTDRHAAGKISPFVTGAGPEKGGSPSSKRVSPGEPDLIHFEPAGSWLTGARLFDLPVSLQSCAGWGR